MNGQNGAIAAQLVPPALVDGPLNPTWHTRAFYLVHVPADTSLAELAGVAGLRWTIEKCFQRAKDDLGLDHCEARSWHGWNRHMTLVMATLAFLARLSAQMRAEAWSKPNKTSPRPIAA